MGQRLEMTMPVHTTARADGVDVPTSETRPLVTIVVPVRNGGQLLRESLDSILAQRYPRLEVIVMDDASTDDTPSVLASYEDRIRVVRQKAPRGIYGNANDGIELANGEFVAVFHADDVYLPDILEREVDLMQRHPEVAAVFAFVVFVHEDGRPFGRQGPPPSEIPASMPLGYSVVLNAILTHRNTFLPTPSALVRTEVYRELGGYRDDLFKNTSDFEMWLRIVRSHPVAIIDEPLMHYRRGHGSSSERYHTLRTDPDRFFQIMDLELAGPGASVASPRALAAYEAHRANDALMRAVSAYVLGDLSQARAIASEAGFRTLLRGSRRSRTIPLAALVKTVTRLPRLAIVADAFSRRWARGSTTRVAV